MKLNETKRNINFELLKLMHDRGFTVNEVAEYFECPLPTIQYYSRTRKWGRFKSFKKGWYDEEIMTRMKAGMSQTQIASILNIPQSFISVRYKQLTNYERKKKERYEWLNKWLDANAVEEN